MEVVLAFFFLFIYLYMMKHDYERCEKFKFKSQKLMRTEYIERVCYLAPTPTIACLIEQEELIQILSFSDPEQPVNLRR